MLNVTLAAVSWLARYAIPFADTALWRQVPRPGKKTTLAVGLAVVLVLLLNYKYTANTGTETTSEILWTSAAEVKFHPHTCSKPLTCSPSNNQLCRVSTPVLFTPSSLSVELVTLFWVFLALFWFWLCLLTVAFFLLCLGSFSVFLPATPPPATFVSTQISPGLRSLPFPSPSQTLFGQVHTPESAGCF